MEIKQFVEILQNLYEPEYGDFKRKIGLYLTRLEESRPEVRTGTNKKLIDQLRTEVVFDPNGDIELTRHKALDLARQLK